MWQHVEKVGIEDRFVLSTGAYISTLPQRPSTVPNGSIRPKFYDLDVSTDVVVPHLGNLSEQVVFIDNFGPWRLPHGRIIALKFLFENGGGLQKGVQEYILCSFLFFRVPAKSLGSNESLGSPKIILRIFMVSIPSKCVFRSYFALFSPQMIDIGNLSLSKLI